MTTIVTMLFTVGFVYGGLALMIGLVLFRPSTSDEG